MIYTWVAWNFSLKTTLILFFSFLHLPVLNISSIDHRCNRVLLTVDPSNVSWNQPFINTPFSPMKRQYSYYPIANFFEAGLPQELAQSNGTSSTQRGSKGRRRTKTRTLSSSGGFYINGTKKQSRSKERHEINKQSSNTQIKYGTFFYN